MRTVLALLLALFCIVPASAQWGAQGFGRPGFNNSKVASTTPPTLSAVSNFVLGGSGSTRTSATVNIGNPAYIATRRVILACSTNAMANGPISSGTINGITANIDLDYEPANADAVHIFSAVVTSGTTNVTVTLNFPGTQFSNDACEVYNVDNSLLNSTTANTGTGTSASTTSLATSSISTSAGGFIVAAGAIGASSTSYAFTGLTTDAFGGTNTNVISSQGSLAGGNLTPTATQGTAQTSSVGAAAWR